MQDPVGRKPARTLPGALIEILRLREKLSTAETEIDTLLTLLEACGREREEMKNGLSRLKTTVDMARARAMA